MVGVHVGKSACYNTESRSEEVLYLAKWFETLPGKASKLMTI